MPRTNAIWEKHNLHPGDREALFLAVSASFSVDTVLYPGSYVDIAPSFVFSDVTYVDTDSTAARFFADTNGVNGLVNRNRTITDPRTWLFVHADYTSDLGLPDGSFDLLVSLYAGFVSRACGRYLRPGGVLLVNSSHGDVAMASIDPQFQLAAVVNKRSGDYAVTEANLETYLIPKRDIAITEKTIEASGRGVPYTKSPFAYVFLRIEA